MAVKLVKQKHTKEDINARDRIVKEQQRCALRKNMMGKTNTKHFYKKNKQRTFLPGEQATNIP